MAAERIRVRATINLPRLRVGDHALVDPTDPYIAELLAGKYLVPEPEQAEDE